MTNILRVPKNHDSGIVDRSPVFHICANGIMIVLSLICILPFLLLVMSSITSEPWLIQNGYTFFPKEIDFAAYRYLLIDSELLLHGYYISAVVAVVGTITNLTLTTLFAYPLSRKDLPGRNYFAFYIFFTMLFNGGLVPTYIMWTQTFHIKNTIWALVVPGLLLNAFNIIMMRTYFTVTIPDSIIEAARIDGAGEGRILAQVVLPMSLPVISTLALLVGLAYWNDWMNGLYYVNQDKYFSVQVLLNKMLLDTQFLKTTAGANLNIDPRQMPSTSIKMAVAVLGALPILAVYPFFQRYFVKGITIGAVKG
jgi:putative aldouronate transport system permease protein